MSNFSGSRVEVVTVHGLNSTNSRPGQMLGQLNTQASQTKQARDSLQRLRDYIQAQSTGPTQTLISNSTSLLETESPSSAQSGPTTIDPAEEKQNSQSKIDSYTERDEELKQEQQGSTTKHKDRAERKEARKDIVEITKERKQIADAKKFWSGEKEFWTKLDDAGPSSRNQDQINELSTQLTDLESQMDEVLPKETSKDNRSQIKDFRQQIADIKSQITRLHSGV